MKENNGVSRYDVALLGEPDSYADRPRLVNILVIHKHATPSPVAAAEKDGLIPRARSDNLIRLRNTRPWPQTPHACSRVQFNNYHPHLAPRVAYERVAGF
jgi:hypothetical protein